MKKIIAFMCFVSIYNMVFAQKTTYILVRHAEKDTTQVGSTMMAANPPLNEAGIERAKKLAAFVKNISIDTIYSTNFTRTLSTAQPTANEKAKTIHIYDHKQLQAFANQLLQATNKTFLIIGHSNTTPTLANYLSNSNTYKQLDESVYNKIYTVTIENGVASTTVVEY
jgi:2,3-bisphosphoglycerate-dependent phosphoglycerate mutase